MDKNKSKVLYLTGLLSFLANSVSAQISGGGQGLIGSTIGSYFGNAANLTELAYDAMAFLLVWLVTYVIFAVVVKLIIENSPNSSVSDTIKEVLLGKGSGSGLHKANGGRNLLIWLSGLIVLSLGPYLGPLLNDIQSMIVAGAGFTWMLILVLGVVGAAIAVLYITGQLGRGAAVASNSVANGASAVRSSSSYSWASSAAKGKGQDAVNWIQNKAGSNTYFLDIQKKIDDIKNSAGWTKKTCPSCSNVHDRSDSTCTSCGYDYYVP